MTTIFTIGVVGNPNSGKTTLFNALTGAKQHVGNWPGVTVERKTGTFVHNGHPFELVDLPGTYSLDVTEESVSVDERITRDYVASHEAHLIVNIVDASNIERNLYLTTQLLEMKVPMIVALNMIDVAQQREVKIDIEKLSKRLGCPVVPLIASKRKRLDLVAAAILDGVRNQTVATTCVTYGEEVEHTLAKLIPLVSQNAEQHNCDQRWLALRLLEGDTLAKKFVGPEVIQAASGLRGELEDCLDDDIDIISADARYGFVTTLTRECVRKTSKVKRSTSDKIDRIVLNRVLGIPFFLVVMYLMFLFTINIGSAFIDFFDILAGGLFVDGVRYLMTDYNAPEWLTVIIANGVGGGIQLISTFIPIIGFLYLFLSVLEDSGYMSRAAFVMDRFMRFIGLPGKAFVPMIVGFGCNVPAIMASRTLEHQRDRILTNIMNPFMSCGARLPVYALFAAAFFPIGGQNIVFGLYLFGIAVAVLTGLIMKNTLLQGTTAPFMMELPSYHIPALQNILLRTWDRLKGFIFRAGKVIIPMVLVLNFLNALGTDGSFQNDQSENSVLSAIGKGIVPAFAPMGLDEENWPAAVGIFTGVLAKEVVVGTLDALYSQMAQTENIANGDRTPKPAEFNLRLVAIEAFQSISDNLKDITDALTDPLGLDIGDVSNIENAAEQQEVVAGTFRVMRARFDGQAGAFAYLLFILLYFPCVAAIAAIYRETGGWAIFVAGWTTGIAYMSAAIFYQLATFSQHPVYSATWITGLSLVFASVVLGLRFWGRSNRPYGKAYAGT